MNAAGPRRSSASSGAAEAAAYTALSLQGLPHLYSAHSNTDSPRELGMPLSGPLLRSYSTSAHGAAAAQLMEQQRMRQLMRHGSMPMPGGGFWQGQHSQPPLVHCQVR